MAEDLKSARTKDGMTSLESLQSSMRSTREFMENLLHKWDGYNDEGLRCEYLVQKALGGLSAAETEEVYIKKRKFGCTCGMCTDGWLSPRMRFRLRGEVNFGHSSEELLLTPSPFVISPSRPSNKTSSAWTSTSSNPTTPYPLMNSSILRSITSLNPSGARYTRLSTSGFTQYFTQSATSSKPSGYLPLRWS